MFSECIEISNKIKLKKVILEVIKNMKWEYLENTNGLRRAIDRSLAEINDTAMIRNFSSFPLDMYFPNKKECVMNIIQKEISLAVDKLYPLSYDSILAIQDKSMNDTEYKIWILKEFLKSIGMTKGDALLNKALTGKLRYPASIEVYLDYVPSRCRPININSNLWIIRDNELKWIIDLTHEIRHTAITEICCPLSYSKDFTTYTSCIDSYWGKIIRNYNKILLVIY